MRSITNLFAMLLILFGIIALAYSGFTYTSKEKVAEVGSVEVNADTQKTVYLSPTAGVISLAAGIVILALRRR